MSRGTALVALRRKSWLVAGLVAFLVSSFTSAHSPAQEPGRERSTQEEQPADEELQDMLRLMGPYTSREFYPSLMRLPDLPVLSKNSAESDRPESRPSRGA